MLIQSINLQTSPFIIIALNIDRRSWTVVLGLLSDLLREGSGPFSLLLRLLMAGNGLIIQSNLFV
jgi:hypothetical protein